MMKRLTGVLSSIVILVLLCSGIFTDFVRFFAWLFTLQYSAPETSLVGGIIVRVLTFLVSYGFVGLIFKMIGWFNGRVMSVAYFIISTLLAFFLSYIVWAIEKYVLVICIVLGVILFCIIAFLAVYFVRSKKGKTMENQDE